ncbi:MAG: DNA adenine methylase [Myxococcota bacterium]|jgi:DNA adenine methylase
MTRSLPSVDARPFLKWAGGKTFAVRRMLATLPPDWRGHYRAPFVGGGALFFALHTTGRLTGASLSDANPALIGLYTNLRDCPKAVITRLQRHAIHHGRAGKLHWKSARRRFNVLKLRDPFDGECSALLLYLQATSFNGLYRENQLGEFNTPINAQATPADVLSPRRLARLQAASGALQGVMLRVCGFSEALAPARCGELVYGDPPYDVLDGHTGHVAYVAGRFGAADQVRLVDALLDVRRRGALVMASNSDTPRIRGLYRDWHRQQLWRSNSIGSRSSGRVAELLMTSWQAPALEVDGV